jgi:hypothetical protein
MAALRSADAAIRRASADAALRRTSPAKYRLAAGFLAGLPGAVREIASMLTDPDVADAAAQSLHRLADTGRSLGLSDFADAAERASTRLRAGDGRRALAEVVLAIDQLQIAGPFAPIAVLGTARTVAGLRAQDDGSAEPLRTFETLDALRDGIAVDWPQALIVPASVGPEALTALCARAPVFVVGVARDEQARLMAAAAGAAGFLGEPLTLPAVLAQVRYAGVARRSRCVAVLGDEAWSRAAIESLNASGLEALRAEGGGTAAVLHGVHPAAVVFGPGTTPETVRTARQHLGRGNVALVAVDSGPSADALRAAGVDDVVEPNAALPLRVLQRIERFEDHRRRSALNARSPPPSPHELARGTIPHARLHAGRHPGRGARSSVSHEHRCTTRARRSCWPTPTTCPSGRARSWSSGTAACTGSWAPTCRSSRTRAAFRCSRSRRRSPRTASTFRYEVDGRKTFLSPERSMAIQQKLGSDIAMVFDECLAFGTERPYAEASVARTTRWERAARRPTPGPTSRCSASCRAASGPTCASAAPRRSRDRLRRLRHRRPVASGEGHDRDVRGARPHDAAHAVAEPAVPDGRRPPAGPGGGVARGVDMFDCVIQTRHARSGSMWTSHGRMRLTDSRYRKDMRPIDDDLHLLHLPHLHPRLPAPPVPGGRDPGRHPREIHNIAWFQQFMGRMRDHRSTSNASRPSGPTWSTVYPEGHARGPPEGGVAPRHGEARPSTARSGRRRLSAIDHATARRVLVRVPTAL